MSFNVYDSVSFEHYEMYVDQGWPPMVMILNTQTRDVLRLSVEEAFGLLKVMYRQGSRRLAAAQEE